jgi:hypothetical protein
VGTVGVVRVDLPVFDDQAGRCGVGVFPVDEHVEGNFPGNGIPQAFSFNAFQIEWVRQVFLDKGQNAVVAGNQVGADQIPVIVADNTAALRTAPAP